MISWFTLRLFKSIKSMPERALQRLPENCLFLKFHATFWTSWVMSSHWGGWKWCLPRCFVRLASALKPKTASKIPLLANFRRRLIRNYRAFAAPLTALIATPWPFRWTPEVDAAFTEVKICFSPCPHSTWPVPTIHSWVGCFQRGCGYKALPVHTLWWHDSSLCLSAI